MTGATAELFANALTLDGRGVHALLWDDMGDLVRALLVFRAAYDARPVRPVLASATGERLQELRELVESRANPDGAAAPPATPLLAVFVPQASSATVGPWLNGWRRPLADPPGTLLVVRHADFTQFLRCAPDIGSFVGPKCADASTMLSLLSAEVAPRVADRLPADWEAVLDQLPGERPPPAEVREWLSVHRPGDGREPCDP